MANYKVGDKVSIVGHSTYDVYGKLCGQTGIVQSISESAGGKYRIRGEKTGLYCWFYEDGRSNIDNNIRIEEIKENKTPMFKAGDKVRLKKEYYKENAFTDRYNTREWKKYIAGVFGKTLTVKRVFEGDDCYLFYAEEYITTTCNSKYFPQECFELVKAKVGDKIRITRYQGGDSEGTVVEVVSLAQYSVSYKSLKSPDGFYGASDDCYEIVVEPEVKEVKRVAKVGEWIKIVNPFLTFGNYEKGDIFKVKEKYGQDSVRVFGTFNTCICEREYVVLENYVPEEKESEIPKEEPKKQIAKVGDFIELTVYNFGDSVGTVAEVIEVNEVNVKYKTARNMRCYYYARHDSYKIVEPPKRKWTEEEITKAKCFLAEELIKGTYKFTYGRKRIDCSNGVETATAKCSSKDEYNQYIGSVVAYCKVSSIKIPEFIRD